MGAGIASHYRTLHHRSEYKVMGMGLGLGLGLRLGNVAASGSTPPPPTSALTQEDGFYILQEDNSKIVLE
jgi:hypothetical protein